MKRKRVESFQTLRGLAILAIILCHTDVRFMFSWGRWGVSVFFVLSGFVMMYNYYNLDRIKQVSVKDNLSFSVHHLKTLYPLYLLTIISVIPFFFRAMSQSFSVLYLVFILIMNFVLFQQYLPFLPGNNASLNRAAWYLSVTSMLYFFFPWILKFYEKRGKEKKTNSLILLWIAFQFIAVLMCMLIEHLFPNGSWQQSTSYWLIYQSPYTRVFDFLIGCDLAYIYLNTDTAFERNGSSFKALAPAGTILCIAAGMVIEKGAGGHLGYLLGCSMVYDLSAILLVKLFYCSDMAGIRISLDTRLLRYIGNISQYLFLINMIVFRFTDSLYYRLPGLEGIGTAMKSGLRIMIGIPVTFLAAWIWTKITKKKIHY